ncbi:MAG: thiolase family protein [Candidatus Freyarchaeota archaeon]
MTKVAIVGVGQTKYEDIERKRKQAYYDMVFEATRKALDDAGIDKGDVDTVVEAAYDLIDGRTISNMYLCTAAAGYLKDESRVAEDGTFALAYAYMRVASGEFDVAVVAAHGNREGPMELVSNYIFDPFFYRPVASNYLAGLAMQATRYMAKYEVAEEDAAQVVVKNRGNGVNNPYAHLQSKVSVEDVVNSKIISWPLRELELPPKSTGACALVIAEENMAVRITDMPIWIDGISWSVDTYHVGSKELAELAQVSTAAQRAYKMAGIDDPVRQLDLAEVHDATAFHELMEYEALGFCGKGEGARLVKEGVTAMSGELPVNPSGGALCADPYPATGLVRVAEAVLQLRGEADKRQVSEAETALVQGLSIASGAAAQTSCIVILRR